MNWKSLVEAENARLYVLPPGWDSKEKIAEQIGCADDSVRRTLAPMVKSGAIETAVFAVWDTVTKRLVRTTAYRRTAPKPAKK